jgi:hypothetical protein
MRAHVFDDIDEGLNEAPEPPDGREPPRLLTRPPEPATPYPVMELGDLLAAAALAIHDKVQAPLALCGSSVLAAAALAVQGFADVVLPTGQRRPLALYILSIAASGERKSSTDNEALVPVEERERELREAHEHDLVPYGADLAAWKAARQAILSDKNIKGRGAKARAIERLGPAPVAPLLPMLTAPEPTYEGLCRLLANGQPSVGVFSAEGGQFIGGHAMNADNKLKTAAGLSDLWDKGLVKRLRAGDGAMILPGRRVSLHLMAQPDVAAIMLFDPLLREQGMLSRLLVTAPDSTAGTRLWREPKPESTQALARYRNKLLGILRTKPPMALDGVGKPLPNELTPRPLPLSETARKLWIEFADVVELEMAPGGELEPVRALANKLPEQAARVAGVLAILDSTTAVAEISEDQLARAIEIVRHHALEALRLSRAGAVEPDLRLAQRLLDWLTRSWPEPMVSLPDVYQRGLNAISDKKTAARIVGILVDHGWLERLPGGAVVAGVTRREVWAIQGKGAPA